MTTIPSAAIGVYDPELAGPEHVALAGFLGGYRGLTRDAYALDLRQFVAFCDERHLGLFEVRRSDIEALGLERGHRTLTILRKGGKTVTILLAPRTARAVDLAIRERDSGPIFITADGRRLDRHGASRVVRRVARRAEITKPIGPHALRHAFITAALDAGVPLRDVQEAASHADPRTTMRYDRARVSLCPSATHYLEHVADIMSSASPPKWSDPFSVRSVSTHSGRDERPPTIHRSAAGHLSRRRRPQISQCALRPPWMAWPA